MQRWRVSVFSIYRLAFVILSVPLFYRIKLIPLIGSWDLNLGYLMIIAMTLLLGVKKVDTQAILLLLWWMALWVGGIYGVFVFGPQVIKPNVKLNLIFLGFILTYIAGTRVLRNERNVKRLLVFLSDFSLLLSISVLLEFSILLIWGIPAVERLYTFLGYNAGNLSLTKTLQYYRAGGFLGTPENTGFALGILVGGQYFLYRYILPKARGKWLKIAIGITALVLTQSRGGVLALIIIVAFIRILNSKNLFRQLSGAVSLSVFTGGILWLSLRYIPHFSLERFMWGIKWHSATVYSGFQAALASPVVGWGWAPLRIVVSQIRTDNYLGFYYLVLKEKPIQAGVVEVFARSGMVGLILFTLIVWRALQKSWRASLPYRGWLFGTLMAILSITGIAGPFLYNVRTFGFPLWFFFTMLAVAQYTS